MLDAVFWYIGLMGFVLALILFGISFIFAITGRIDL
jgi:NADH:ubiquinone oxidoreductase subunit 2 (subunit N)